LTPGEAKSIFDMELAFNKVKQQAPVEAAKFFAPAFVPQSFGGQSMPGMEPGGVYAKNLPPGMADMFKYQPTSPGAMQGLMQAFTPNEDEMMQMARAAMQKALQTGVGSTDVTNTASQSNTVGGSTTSGGGTSQTFGPPPTPPPDIAGAFAAAGGPGVAAPSPSGPTGVPTVVNPTPRVPQGTNPVSQAWSSLLGHFR
jgi:hypothetical protein